MDEGENMIDWVLAELEFLRHAFCAIIGWEIGRWLYRRRTTIQLVSPTGNGFVRIPKNAPDIISKFAREGWREK